MAETTHPSAEGPARVRTSGSSVELLRFDLGERVLHWVNASLFAVAMATAAVLYVPGVSAVVGRRELVRTAHVLVGLALPLPILLLVVLRRSGAAFRADVRRLNRWSSDDRRWLRSAGRDPFVANGKFNAGQKLNAAFTGGAILVMVGTGSIMRWPNSFPLSWRTGATFVHDWVFVLLVVSITGHVLFALNDPDALHSMVSGWIPASWARRHAPRWWDGRGGADRSDDMGSPPG